MSRGFRAREAIKGVVGRIDPDFKNEGPNRDFPKTTGPAGGGASSWRTDDELRERQRRAKFEVNEKMNFPRGSLYATPRAEARAHGYDTLVDFLNKTSPESVAAGNQTEILNFVYEDALRGYQLDYNSRSSDQKLGIQEGFADRLAKSFDVPTADEIKSLHEKSTQKDYSGYKPEGKVRMVVSKDKFFAIQDFKYVDKDGKEQKDRFFLEFTKLPLKGSRDRDKFYPNYGEYNTASET